MYNSNSIKHGSGAQQASSLKGSKGFFSGVKLSVHKASH